MSTNSGNRNSGDGNSGNRNSGDGNSGNRNSGDWNSGYGNSGDGNSGDGNSGDWNSGDGNSGDGNSGNRNSGYWNSGYWNSGDGNSGNWNSGNRNSGNLNTDTPNVRVFDKDTGISYEDWDFSFPSYFYFRLTEWIDEGFMTNEEKEENPDYKTLGGYLKTYDYHEAWRKSWNETDQEDREKTLTIPNWNNEKFKKISGIDVEAELNKPAETIEIEGKKYTPAQVKKALKALDALENA